MPSSTTTALSRQPLKKVLEGVTDPRDRRGVRHPLVSAGCLAVTGILAGCRSLTAIWEHAADLEPADLGALGLEEGRALPSVKSLGVVFFRSGGDGGQGVAHAPPVPRIGHALQDLPQGLARQGGCGR